MNVIDLLNKLDIFIALSDSAPVVSVGQNGSHCEGKVHSLILAMKFSY